MSTSSTSPSSVRSSPPPPTSPSSTSSISPTSSIASTVKSINALPWILHHILESNFAPELPLIVMFSINTGQSLPRLKEIYGYWQLDGEGKLIAEFLSSLGRITPSIAESTVARIRNPSAAAAEPYFNRYHCPDDRFMDHGNQRLLDIDFPRTLSFPDTGRQQKDMHSLSQDRSLGRGLQVSFVQKYVLCQVFVAELDDVNFDHSLTALDYLRDVEFTRRAALREAAHRIGITEDDWRSVLGGNHAALRWVEETQARELRFEEIYASLFVDLRIWTMVHLLKSSKDYHKGHSIAMLNTLFPPAVRELPNNTLDPKALHRVRSCFYEHIVHVENRGFEAITQLFEKMQKPDTPRSWVKVRGNLKRYMYLTEKTVAQARDIYAVQYFENIPMSLTPRGRSSTSFKENDATPKVPKLPKTLKTATSKRSLPDLGSIFGRRQNDSNVSVVDISKKVDKELYPKSRSKSMVDVSNIENAKFTKSMVDIRAKQWDTAPTIHQPKFDSLAKTRDRAISKVHGFVPPPLEYLELEGLLEAPPVDKPLSSEPVTTFTGQGSFEQRRNSSDSEFDLMTDVHAPKSHKKPKPDLQIDTKSGRSRQFSISPSLKSAPLLGRRPYAIRYEDASDGPRPSTAESIPRSKGVLMKERTATSPLMSPAGPPPLVPLPALPSEASLPKNRYRVREPALLPPPLNINRVRQEDTSASASKEGKSSGPGAEVALRGASTSTSTITTPQAEPRRQYKSVEEALPFLVKPESNQICRTTPRQSNTVAASALKLNHPATVRLPSDNLEFLNRPYDPDATPTQPAVIKKDTSLGSLINRNKSSTTTLNEDFNSFNPLGISGQSETSSVHSTNNTPRPSYNAPQTPKPILKKQSSFGVLAHCNHLTSPKTNSASVPKTPRSSKSISFEPFPEFFPNYTHDYGDSEEEVYPPPRKVKKQASFATDTPRKSSDTLPTYPPRGLRKESTIAQDSRESLAENTPTQEDMKRMASRFFGGAQAKCAESHVVISELTATAEMEAIVDTEPKRKDRVEVTKADLDRDSMDIHGVVSPTGPNNSPATVRSLPLRGKTSVSFNHPTEVGLDGLDISSVASPTVPNNSPMTVKSIPLRKKASSTFGHLLRITTSRDEASEEPHGLKEKPSTAFNEPLKSATHKTLTTENPRNLKPKPSVQFSEPFKTPASNTLPSEPNVLRKKASFAFSGSLKTSSPHNHTPEPKTLKKKTSFWGRKREISESVADKQPATPEATSPAATTTTTFPELALTPTGDSAPDSSASLLDATAPQAPPAVIKKKKSIFNFRREKKPKKTPEEKQRDFDLGMERMGDFYGVDKEAELNERARSRTFA